MKHEIVGELLQNIHHAAIATYGEDNEPWNTPVFYAHDEAMNIYWSSHLDAQHSQNILKNSAVFVVIFGGNYTKGIYIQAKTRALEDIEEVNYALALLEQRRGRAFPNHGKFFGDGSQRIFVATPTHVWINGSDKDVDGDFIRDYRIVIQAGSV